MFKKNLENNEQLNKVVKLQNSNVEDVPEVIEESRKLVQWWKNTGMANTNIDLEIVWSDMLFMTMRRQKLTSAQTVMKMYNRSKWNK